MDNEMVETWLRDYVAMMRANLGALSASKIEGLYDSIVDRILEVEKHLRTSHNGSER